MRINYKTIRPHLTTGSIVLFSGKGLISTAIKAITQCHWSHVGMVLKLPEYDFLCVWESTTLSNVDDITTGNKREGVQLTPLSQRLEKYDGDIAVRLLKDINETDINIHALMQLRKTLAGKAYEADKIELLCAASNCNEKPDLSSIFCSELVAEAYQQMGLLHHKTPSNQYTPADFSSDKKLQLLKGSLGEEIIINAS